VARATDKANGPVQPRVPADETLLHADLGEWAGQRIAQGGRRDALLGRVEALHLSLDGKSIEARVRGNRPLPYSVEVQATGKSVSSQCTCSREAPGPCRHAVAALETLRFPAPAAGLPALGQKRRGAGPVGPGPRDDSGRVATRPR